MGQISSYCYHSHLSDFHFALLRLHTLGKGKNIQGNRLVRPKGEGGCLLKGEIYRFFWPLTFQSKKAHKQCHEYWQYHHKC